MEAVTVRGHKVFSSFRVTARGDCPISNQHGFRILARNGVSKRDLLGLDYLSTLSKSYDPWSAQTAPSHSPPSIMMLESLDMLGLFIAENRGAHVLSTRIHPDCSPRTHNPGEYLKPCL